MSYSMKFEPNLPEHCNIYDRMLCHDLISELLSSGYSVTVNDGEEDCLEQSTDFADILDHMSSSGEDVVFAIDADGSECGWFYLIYDNGSMGEPMICITDYSANPLCEHIWNKLDKKHSLL